MNPSFYAGICVNTYERRHGYVPALGAIMTKRFIERHSQLFVWETDNECILSFQGSNGKRDWRDNLHFFPIFRRKEKIPNFVTGDFELVHSGFFRNYKPLKKYVRETIESTTKKIVICGHSLGGANALLCLADVKRYAHIKPDTYTFGAPRVGNKAFYDHIDQHNLYQFKNNNDLVCNVPFLFFGFYEPERIEISDGKSELRGWTPFGSWKDHYPMKYYKACIEYDYAPFSDGMI